MGSKVSKNMNDITPEFNRIKVKAALETIRNEAHLSGLSSMSDEEIDVEIYAMRSENSRKNPSG